jgi:F0F1-type ATP synthase assembly protein I
MKAKKDMARSQVFSDLLKLSSLGLEMGAAVVIGLLLGTYLDRHFGTEPWLTFIFLGFGFAAAGRAVVRVIRKEIPAENKEDED